MKVIIDTSVWVEYFNGKNQEIVTKVKGLIENEKVALCGIVLSEIIAGIRRQKDERIIIDALDALPYIETSLQSWILAGRIARELSEKGRKIPLTDLIVAAIAIENDCELFTFDTHFDLVTKCKIFS